MSGNVGEQQAHHTLSTVAPRKRPRQESACDVDSGPGDNESGGASASGSSDNGENGDGRQGGSQKRARSEGHGDTEVSQDTIPWHRSVESRVTSTHTSLAAPSSTRPTSGSTSTTPRYLNSIETIRGLPSEESFIPLPPASSAPEMQRQDPNHGNISTVQDDIAHSMAFDEQMDVLRHSPVTIPSSPLTIQLSPSTDIPMEVQTALEPEPSPSSGGTSPDSSGEFEVSESEARAQSETNQSDFSGRLHALADTASLHSRILHAHTTRARSSLPPIPPPFPSETAPATSSTGPSYSAPPSRLRLLRRNEQPRSQSRPASTLSLDFEHDLDRSPVERREMSRSTDDVVQTSTASGIRRPSSTSAALSPSLSNGSRQAASSYTYVIDDSNRPTSSRFDIFQEMHDPFDPFELDGHPVPDSPGDLPLFGVMATAGRHTWRQSPRDRQNARLGPEVAPDNHLIGPGREGVSALGARRDAGVPTPGRQSGNDRGPGSFWTSIFDETVSERDGSSRRPNLVFDDTRRHTSDSERDVPSRHHSRVSYDILQDDLRRRSSVWDLPRRPSEVPHVASTSSSSTSSFGRTTSRSLLDPNLSFGSGSSGMTSHASLSSTSEHDHEPAHRARYRPMTRLGSLLADRMGPEAEPFEPSRSALSSDRRRSEGPTSYSPFFSSPEPTRDNENSPLPGPPSRYINNPRNASADATRFTPIHPHPVDREQTFHTPLHPTYDPESPTTAHQPSSPDSDSWDSDPALPDIPGHHSSRPRRNFSPTLGARHHVTSSTLRETDRPFSPFGLSEHPLPVSSRFRLRRYTPQDQGPPSGPELATDSMEGIIPESNARENDSLNLNSFRRRASHAPVMGGYISRLDPPPRPVEPRISTWDAQHPSVAARLPQLRSPSPPIFPPIGSHFDASDTIHPSVRPRRPADFSRSIFEINPPVSLESNEQPLAQRRLTPSVDNDERRLSLTAPNSTRLDARHEQGASNHSTTWPPTPPVRHEVPRPESFNELVRRRAARAEMQAARANRRPPSPDALARPTYRLPRPSFLLDDDDIAHRDRMARLERRTNASLSGRSLPGGESSASDDSRRERQRAALFLERSISSRHAFGDRNTNRQEWDRYYDNIMQPALPGPSQPSDRDERSEGPNNGIRTRISERLERLAPFPPPMHSLRPQNVGGDGARERQELHDAIGRRARDDELSTRRSLPNTERTRHITARDPMSIETTRNLQRRLRESEAEVGRALHALDQWGELEGGPGDSDPTHSRLHRFGETLRRRRVPPAFNFSDSWDQERAIPPGPARPGRRSPSPTTTATRLQARQARYSRAQGRFREMGTDIFGEPRSRGAYASRLDLLGGSRFSSRYLTRNIGDYMRDEDFDASYENLVRLAASVGEAKPRGTPAHLLAAMPTGFYKDFATSGCDSRCPICLDDYKDLDPILQISDCNHWFHKECLEQWLSGENSCPICRRRIRGRAEKGPPDNVPGPSGSRRDDGSDDDGPGGGSGGPGRAGSPGLTLEELSSYATVGW